MLTRKVSFLLSSIAFLSVVGYGASTTVETKVRGTDRYGVALDFSGGLITVGGAYGGNFLAGVTLPVEKNSAVRLGFDSGITFTHATWIPILMSVIYNLGTPGNAVHPYIGGAVGPMIRVSSTKFSGLTVSDELTGDGVRLAILLRPGIRVGLTDNLDLTGEIPLGGITGTFVIGPHLGVSLKL